MTGFHDPDNGRSVARYMGLTMREMEPASPGEVRLHGSAPAASYLRGPDGGIAFGALLTLADSVGGLCGGLAALPGWVVSTNLMLRAVHRDVIGPIGLTSTTLRVGSRATVTSVTLSDSGAQDRPIAVGTLTSAVLQPAEGPPVYQRPLVLECDPPDPATAPSLREFLGAAATAPNQVSLEVVDRIRNPWGILHGGATAALVDLAGLHAVGGHATTDAVLHFVSPGRVGPITATVTELGTRADGHLLRVDVTDVGADDRLVATAITTVTTD